MDFSSLNILMQDQRKFIKRTSDRYEKGQT